MRESRRRLGLRCQFTRQVVSGHVAEVPIHFGHFFHTETSATQEQDDL